jgi:LuxR family maltose regulon positive regulatory protein
MQESDFILKTKLFLPQITSDFIEREGLQSKLEQLKVLPIMLVSASSGYGKSMVISNFLTNQKEDYVWLSLSGKENDFQQFIKYFIKAIQVNKDSFGENIIELNNAPNPPSIDEITELMENELAELQGLLYLAIDDYHLIKNEKIHQFLSKIFEYPLPYFRLIIITRRDPELPLPSWRNKGKLIEIRSADLKFNKNEIRAFYAKAIDYHPDDIILAKIEKATEGWISGLRMLLLSTNDNNELQHSILNFKNSKFILELVNAVLKNQPNHIIKKLLKLSLLKKFNTDLFSELCLKENEKKNKEVLFQEFTSKIIRSNMFITALDNQHDWFRFHHLFSQQLNVLLLDKYNKKKIQNLRRKAGKWYYENGLFEDAIEHYINADEIDEALKIFSEYRLILMSETRFQRLEELFNQFSDEIAINNGILLVTKGWIILQKGNIPEMAKHLEPLEDLLKQEKHPQETLDLLIGELHSMKTFDRYLSNVDMKACLEHSKQAIKLLKDKNPYALGMAWVYYGASMQHLGHSVEAKKDIFNVLEKASNPMLRGHLLLILCFLDWFEGDLGNMLKTAEHLLRLGHESGIKMLIANGNIFSGMAHYYQKNDEKALEYLLESHELRRYTYLHMSFGTGMALAHIYAEKGEIKKRDEIIKAYETTALSQGGKLFHKITKSCWAELTYIFQNDASGLKWAQENDYKDFLPLASLFAPEIVQARILAKNNDPHSHRKAQDILNVMIPFFEDRNDKNVLIRALVIQAVLYSKNGDSINAVKTIQKVSQLSCIGNYIRPYMEFGGTMKNLLISYKDSMGNDKHVDGILHNFNNEANYNNIILSNREKEVLILAVKMTNKEVGNQLFISEKTVKTHITNINKKLKAGSKLEAIVRAKELSLI